MSTPASTRRDDPGHGRAAARVLVTYGSKMGSTAEIATAVASRLRHADLDVTLQPVAEAANPAEFDAVVVGSAIYAMRWLKSVRRFLRRNRQALAARPTWLFESGPCGPLAEQRHGTPAAMLALAEELGSPPPKTFGGNLDPARATSRIARWVASSDVAADYRDWTEITSWADGIAAEIIARSTASAP